MPKKEKPGLRLQLGGFEVGWKHPGRGARLFAEEPAFSRGILTIRSCGPSRDRCRLDGYAPESEAVSRS